jgi:hypothetical protein
MLGSLMRRALVLAGVLILAGAPGCAAWLESDDTLTYTVNRGDTLFVIAKAHGVTVDELKRWNALDSDLIEIGQELRLERQALAAPVPVGKKSRPAPKRGNNKTASKKLLMPKAKPCLAGPSLNDDVAEDGYRGSAGLTPAGIKTAISTFLPEVNHCFAEAPSVPQEELVLDFRVGCDGQVESIEVSSAGDWDTEMTDCVSATLRYTPFPAHALPDGDTFLYPIRLAQ